MVLLLNLMSVTLRISKDDWYIFGHVSFMNIYFIIYLTYIFIYILLYYYNIVFYYYVGKVSV